MKPTYILGTGLSHNGSSCLMRDGEVIVAIEKERLTRVKHDGFNDSATVQYCLDSAGITMSDLTLVVQNANFSMLPAGNEWFNGTRPFNSHTPIVTISHHLAHAYSAVGTSPFDESAVLVIDGCGNALDDCIDLAGAIIPENPTGDLRSLYFEKDSYYIYADNKMRALYKDMSPWGVRIKEQPMTPLTTRHSIGGLYSAASAYTFTGMDDPGKLMGLAHYGQPGVYECPIFDLRDGRVFVRQEWIQSCHKPCRSYEQFLADFQYYADVAWWVQAEIERALLYLVGQRHEQFPHENLCYAGGVALNAVANRRILLEGPFRRVYIQPGAGDHGLAIGCAYYGWLEVLKRAKVRHNSSTCFGKEYSSESISDVARSAGIEAMLYRGNDIVRRCAQMLANGKVIGWYQGGCEFGPRALGNRSILADPRRPDVRDFINREVKRREDFRPFAPSVIATDASIYFDCGFASPYMLLVAPVRPEWRERIPSVVHCDGSARIQTVEKDASPLYYGLLEEFKRETGIGILLNTSFNRRQMPIVETPAEAVELFQESPLDALAIGPYLFIKPDTPSEIGVTGLGAEAPALGKAI